MFSYFSTKYLLLGIDAVRHFLSILKNDAVFLIATSAKKKNWRMMKGNWTPAINCPHHQPSSKMISCTTRHENFVFDA